MFVSHGGFYSVSRVYYLNMCVVNNINSSISLIEWTEVNFVKYKDYKVSLPKRQRIRQEVEIER